MKKIYRRDFLKVGASMSLSLIGSPFLRLTQPVRKADPEKKNVLIIVFDAFSALHTSLYGYPRETTPNLTRLADRAIVYHNHYAAGNFTTSGTASLLTGVYPWKHRAFDLFRPVVQTFATKNLFHAFDDYYRIAYTHNPVAARLLEQFSSSLDKNIPVEEFLLTNDGIVEKVFSKDDDAASVGWDRYLKQEQGYGYSLFLSMLYRELRSSQLTSLKSQFPRGLPSIRGDNYFTLETVVTWLSSQAERFPQPFLGYFHFIPPHQPYSTRIEFYNRFQNDGFVSMEKEEDVFSEGESIEFSLRRRQQYDEYILYLDWEFGRLFDQLQATGLLENTWVILTSDHGELFERGIIGHNTPVLYEPVIRVPLMIFEPGRTTRADIYDQTSAVDLLPTLLKITGGRLPEWSDGNVLSPFSNDTKPLTRNIYALDSRDTASDSPLEEVALMMLEGENKLVYFSGYPELNDVERVELYNIAEDPEELNNLYTAQSKVGNRLLEKIKGKLAEVNRPYQ